MEASDLELYTAQELIAELMRRKTFLGIVVHADQDCKAERWSGEGLFKVHYNGNLDAAEAGRLLDRIGEYIGRQGD